LEKGPHCIIRFVDSFFGLIVSSLIFIYFVTLVDTKKDLRTLKLYLSAPILILLILYILTISFFDTYPETYTWQSFKKVLLKPEPLIRIFCLIVFAIEFLILIFLIFKMIRKYRKSLVYHSSLSEKINLIWAYCILILLILYGVSTIIAISTQTPLYQFIFQLFSIVTPFVIFILGYKQTDIALESRDIECSETISLLNDGAEKTFMDKIEECIKQKQLYLERDLNLKYLAEEIGTNRSYISKAINSEKGSFYEYINGFRIEYAIQLLKTKENLKLSDISEMSGFKSYPVFCRLFKEKAGMLPGEFIKQQNKL